MVVFQNATLLGYMLVCSFTPGPGIFWRSIPQANMDGRRVCAWY